MLLLNGLKQNNIRYYLDDRNNISPGYKFNEWEMKGVPIRIEVGPRDIENNSILIVRRDTGEKKPIKISDSLNQLLNLIDEIQLTI